MCVCVISFRSWFSVLKRSSLPVPELRTHLEEEEEGGGGFSEDPRVSIESEESEGANRI